MQFSRRFLGFCSSMLLGAITLVATGCASGCNPSSARASNRKLAFGISTSGVGDNDFRRVDELEAKLGIRFSSITWYTDWRDGFSTELAKRIHDRGSLPVFTWQPQIPDPSNPKETIGVTYASVRDGKEDGTLLTIARDVARLDFLVCINLAPEMNGRFSRYYVGKCADQGMPRSEQAKQFQAFYRYVVDFFRKNGATNVIWVFGPNMRSSEDEYTFAELFPGKSHVNRGGIDGYNWANSKSWSTWQNFAQVFGQSVREMQALGVPVYIMETGCAPAKQDRPDQNKIQWVTDLFAALRTPAFASVAGVTYFDYYKPEENEPDWRMDSPSPVLNAFKDSLARFEIRTLPRTP